MAGAKKPAAMKNPMAGAHSADSGTKNGTNIQKVTALVAKETTEPVRALELTKPRRTNI